jgi:hypothetical protein
MLMWDFHLKDEEGRAFASINRNWSGFGKELFTDAGRYVIRMDSSLLQDTGLETSPKELTLNEVTLSFYNANYNVESNDFSNSNLYRL